MVSTVNSEPGNSNFERARLQQKLSSEEKAVNPNPLIAIQTDCGSYLHVQGRPVIRLTHYSGWWAP